MLHKAVGVLSKRINKDYGALCYFFLFTEVECESCKVENVACSVVTTVVVIEIKMQFCSEEKCLHKQTSVIHIIYMQINGIPCCLNTSFLYPYVTVRDTAKSLRDNGFFNNSWVGIRVSAKFNVFTTV
jgi:hypothetical protein